MNEHPKLKERNVEFRVYDKRVFLIGEKTLTKKERQKIWDLLRKVGI